MPAKDRDTYIDPDAEEDYFSAEEHDSVGSGDDFDQGPSSRGGKRVGGLGGGKKGAESRLKSKGKGGDAYAWEGSISRTWDQVREDDGGSLELSVQEAIARARRKKLQQSGQAVRRTIIRHLVLMIDLSRSMTDRDLRPSRFDLSLEYARAFISEWFDQNPLGQIGVVALRNGIGERMGEMSGNPQDVLRSIADRDKLLPAGEPSLQNAIEMARGTMSHLPSHASREIVVIFGSLTTCDPDNIFDTLEGCVKDKIRISIVALAAEMKVCRELCEKTGGTFAVAMNEGHFKDVLFELVPPPAQRAAAPAGGPGRPGGASSAAELMLMGFPSRLPETSPPSLCACHSTIKSEGFICPRCKVKLCDVPTDCDVCGLMIVSSPHLARSYHHLFPVQGYRPVMSMTQDNPAGVPAQLACHGCSVPFPLRGSESMPGDAGDAAATDGISPFGRYRCPKYRQWSHIIPDRCPKGQFCPDEEDACQPLLAVGSLCQLNRDDECQPPPNYNELAGPNNHNGSVCLNYTCMWANATLGNDCVVENTAYVGYEAGSGTQYFNVVSRGNCVTGLYCDSQSLKCLKTLDIGAACTADKECVTDNCTDQGVCGPEPNTSKHLPVAIYVVVAICILGLMGGVIGGLYFVHRRDRTEEREKRAQYWREQEQFRQNIMQMREQARTSLLSLPWQSQPASPRNYSGANLEEYNQNKDFNSITPMLHAAAQPSGLRNEFSDNGSEDNGGTEETLVMRPGPRAAVAGNGSSTSTGRRAGAPTKRI